MADAAVRAAREAGGTVVLLDESGGGSCSCVTAVPGVVGTVTRGRALFEAEATAPPGREADSGGEELIDVPLELTRRRCGRPHKLRP